MAQLLATKNALPCSNGCLLWGNGSTWVLMEWAKIFIQNFFAAKVFVWIIDEEISDRKIHLSPISRVRTFPGTFFHLWVSPDRGRQRVAKQKFQVVRTGFEPWTFGMPAERHNHYTAELCYSKASNSAPMNVNMHHSIVTLNWLTQGQCGRTVGCRAKAPSLQWGGCVQSGPPTWV